MHFAGALRLRFGTQVFIFVVGDEMLDQVHSLHHILAGSNHLLRDYRVAA